MAKTYLTNAQPTIHRPVTRRMTKQLALQAASQESELNLSKKQQQSLANSKRLLQPIRKQKFKIQKKIIQSNNNRNHHIFLEDTNVKVFSSIDSQRTVQNCPTPAPLKLKIKKQTGCIFDEDDSCDNNGQYFQERSTLSLENSFEDPHQQIQIQISKEDNKKFIPSSSTSKLPEFKKKPKNSIIIRRKQPQIQCLEKIKYQSQYALNTFEFSCYRDEQLYQQKQCLQKLQEITVDDDFMTDDDTIKHYVKVCFTDLVEAVYRQYGIVDQDHSNSHLWQHFRPGTTNLGQCQ